MALPAYGGGGFGGGLPSLKGFGVPAFAETRTGSASECGRCPTLNTTTDRSERSAWGVSGCTFVGQTQNCDCVFDCKDEFKACKPGADTCD